MTQALSGLRVVDLSRVLGGPYCTKILGDHGADVIKVEPPGGDETRAWGPPWQRDAQGDPITSAYYHGINWNKRGVAIDLASAKGRDVLLRLLEGADVLVENFKTGTLERWGLGYESLLRERFPRLIYCRITGFGVDGPLGGLPGYDAVAQAMTGLLGVNGAPVSGPLKIGVPVVDMVCGLNAAIGILAALAERSRSGEGQLVESTLFDAGVGILHPHSSNFFAERMMPELRGNGHPNVVPYDLFDTRTRRVFLGVGNDRQFAKMCAVLGTDELASDPRFATNAARSQHRAELTRLLEPLLATRDGEALAQELLAAGVPAGPLEQIDEVLDGEHARHRALVIELGGQRGPGSSIKLGRTPAEVHRLPPRFGQHSREVLAELGYSTDEIDSLVGSGAVRDGAPG